MSIDKKIAKARNDDLVVGVVGLGYVGLPLAVGFGKHYKVVGFDINTKRINELSKGIDSTGEVSKEAILSSNISFTHSKDDLKDVDVIIVAVPTPVDKIKDPDLRFIKDASKIVGGILQPHQVVVYESTVWPGMTEEVCIPILEHTSGLKWKKDFFVGYSPERINPGDREHTLENIVKIVAGDTSKTAELLRVLYGKVVKAGIYVAPDIKTAEAAKVIENIQRDINIALMNELSIIFSKIGLDTKEVLKAAQTKWNFLRFEPGLVGGHCIPVDPYYLAYKSREVGYFPKVILSGREINEYMPKHIATQIVKHLLTRDKKASNFRILILGIAFKENVPDIRNSKVYDLYESLRAFGLKNIDVYDPVVKEEDVMKEYGIRISQPSGKYDVVIFAVKHEVLLNNMDENVLMNLLNEGGLFVDVKRVYNKKAFLSRGFEYLGL